MQVTFKIFRSALKSWEKLCQDASDFASSLPEGHVISISHSGDHSDGVVVVWYYMG